jgi:hypothetical protein
MRNFFPLVLNSNETPTFQMRLSFNQTIIGSIDLNGGLPTGTHACPGTGTASFNSNCLTCTCPRKSIEWCPTRTFGCYNW